MMFEDEKEKVMTAQELVQMEDQLYQDAQNQDDEDCSYTHGSIRQPVFVCQVCVAKSGNTFGICQGCSLHCHLHTEIDDKTLRSYPSGNFILEIFEKRDFTCDCGTTRSGCKCQFQEQDVIDITSTNTTTTSTNQNTSTPRPDNTTNVYGHNFQGKYCWCDALYDHTTESEHMFQCQSCLEWYHEKCIRMRGTNVIKPDDLKTDFLCNSCLDRMPVLSLYPEIVCNNFTNGITNVPSFSTPIQNCPLKEQMQTTQTQTIKSAFLFIGWEKRLCRCVDCLELYSKNGLKQLLEELDEPTTTTTTENNNSQSTSMGELNTNPTADTGLSSTRPSSREEIEEKALADVMNNPQIPVQKRHEMIYAYQELSNALKSSFRKIAEEGRTVTKDDISSIFSNLAKNKRKREDYD